MGLRNIFKGVTGVEVTESTADIERAQAAHHERILLIWKWVRAKIDIAAENYVREGDPEGLKALCEPQMLERFCAELDRQRAAEVRVMQPDRQQRTQPQIRVIDFVTDPRSGQTTKFTIEETFHDRSVVLPLDADLDGMEQPQIIAEVPGEQRAIRVEVTVHGPRVFRINEIRRFGLGN